MLFCWHSLFPLFKKQRHAKTMQSKSYHKLNSCMVSLPYAEFGALPIFVACWMTSHIHHRWILYLLYESFCAPLNYWSCWILEKCDRHRLKWLLTFQFKQTNKLRGIPLPQISHRWGFSPEWIIMWRWTSPEAANL